MLNGEETMEWDGTGKQNIESDKEISSFGSYLNLLFAIPL